MTTEPMAARRAGIAVPAGVTELGIDIIRVDRISAALDRRQSAGYLPRCWSAMLAALRT